MYYLKRSFYVLLCLFLFFSVIPASAEKRGEMEFDSMVVTAEKREENIQKVPSGISVFTATLLEDSGVKNINDIIARVPNMYSGTMRGNEQIAIRGIPHSMFTGKSPVVLYVDGVPTDQVFFFEADLNNIERVEVLRGPQGVLYGKNAIGGIINVVSKEPGNEFEGKVTAEFAEHETYGSKAIINGPIIRDRLFFSLSGSYSESRGFMKNRHPDEDYFDSREKSQIKTRLKYIASDRLETDIHLGFANVRDGGDAYIASKKVSYIEYRDPEDKKDIDSFNTAVNLKYKGNYSDINSITTLSNVEIDSIGNWMIPNPMSNRSCEMKELKTFTQELRIQSKDDDSRFKWLGGIYYLFEDKKQKDHSLVYNTKAGMGYYLKDNWPSDTEEKTEAVFGQATFRLTQKLSLIAGVRYEKNNINMKYRHVTSDFETGEPIPVYPFNGQSMPVKYEKDEDWECFLPKFSISYSVDDDFMVFANIAKGYLSGGLNAFEDDPAKAKFNAQESINYEIGLKSSWFDNKFIFNGNLYYITIDDMHVWASPSPNVYIASNAAKAHSYGAEVEAFLRPGAGLEFFAGIGINNAEFDDYTNMMGIDCSENSITNSPEYTINLSAQYRHHLGIYSRLEFLGVGKTWFDDTNKTKEENYEIVNAKIGYERENWDFYIYANNLLDTEYFENMYETVKQYTVGDPRVVGVMASFRF